ncbi:Type-1 glutamine synthetase 2 [Termitomyces sp. J132]|nr:Type-1 glutamine synthetase 2 [Termitomyces sp. J132]
MTTLVPPKSLQELVDYLSGDTKVKVAGIDVDGVLRGKFMSKEKFLSAVSSDGFGFCSVIFGWDIHDTVYTRELLISNKKNGYKDVIASIDLSSYRRIPWENNVPFFLVSFLDPDTKQPLNVDPRGITKIASERAVKIGRECYAGVEYEYFNFKETAASVEEKNFTNLTPLTPGNHGYSLLRTQLNNEYFNDIFDLGRQFRIPIEGHHTETGPGVLETALAYTKVLDMADNAVLFKYLTKSVGMKHGVMPSFMAKPWGNLPGCSGHVHVSLRDSNGTNVFALAEGDSKEGRKDAQYDDTRYVSQEGEWFLAGILDGIADVMPMLVPTINGYKRLVAGEAFWAPNAVTYGYDSRAASVRIISPPSVPPSATRLEIRVPGADMNPYFALSAIFLLGLRGIEKKLALPCKPIGLLTVDDKASGEVKRLPTSLEAATQRMMRPDSVAREPGMFGDDFIDHYGGTREHEVRLWNQAVTNWEGSFTCIYFDFSIALLK